MFRKPVQCNCFIYYGVIASEGEVMTVMKCQKFEGKIEDFFKVKQLSFQRVGNAKKSARYIIGKELFGQKAFTQMEIGFDERGNMTLLNSVGQPINVKLSEKEQQDEKMKIYSLGFFSIANYYLIHNYEFNKI